MQKRCFKCKKKKDIQFFYRHPQMGDKHLGKCKSCTKKDVSGNYRKNREHYIQYEKARWKNPERRKKSAQYLKNRRLKNPGKNKARAKVSNGLRNGKIKKEPCQICGNQKVEAHHPDYRRPLFVQWLCRTHHLAIDGKQSF